MHQRLQPSDFRDLAEYNPNIRKGLVFRSGFRSEKDFYKRIEEHQIQTIIDLRCEYETDSFPHDNRVVENMNYFHLPIAHSGDARRKALYALADLYLYYVTGNCPQIKKIFELLEKHAQEGLVIHCFQGKDRTGFLSVLIHLLAGAPAQPIEDDYLASGEGLRPGLLSVFYDAIDEYGGITSYLEQCGVPFPLQKSIKKNILKNY